MSELSRVQRARLRPVKQHQMERRNSLHGIRFCFWNKMHWDSFSLLSVSQRNDAQPALDQNAGSWSAIPKIQYAKWASKWSKYCTWQQGLKCLSWQLCRGQPHCNLTLWSHWNELILLRNFAVSAEFLTLTFSPYQPGKIKIMKGKPGYCLHTSFYMVFEFISK